MANTQPKLLNYLKVFSPSAIGLVFYVALAAAIIFANQFSFINKFLQLPTNLHVGREIARLADTGLTATIGSSKTTTLVVGLFWAGVGIVVYFLLRSLAKVAVELDEDIGAATYVYPKGADRSRPIRSLFARLILQGIAVAGLFAVVLGPLAEAIHRPVLTHLLNLGIVSTYIVWFIVLFLLFHFSVVLARLVVLKPRLFG
jgi:hypothetical protein